MGAPSPIEKYIVTFCELAFPVQALLGIGGNLLNLLVLLSKHMRSRTNTLLACAAISDVFFLLCLIPQNLSRHSSWVYQECEDDQRPINPNGTRCYTDFYYFFIDHKHDFTFLVNWFSATSSWMMVVVSMDRFLAIKSPLSPRRRLCAHRKYLIIPGILVFSASFTSYNLFAVKVVRSNETGRLDQVPAFPSHVMTMFLVSSMFGQIFIPLVLLFLLNFFLIYYLRHRRQFLDAANSSSTTTERSRRSTKSSTDESPPLLDSPPPSAGSLVEPRHITARISTSWNRELQRCERRVTVMVTAIVSSYVVSHLPSALVCAYVYLPGNEVLYSDHMAYTLTSLSNFCVVSGKVANFFLFCTSSKHFRMRLRETLYRWRKKDVTTRESQQYPSRSIPIPLNRVVDSNHNNNNNHT